MSPPDLPPLLPIVAALLIGVGGLTVWLEQRGRRLAVRIVPKRDFFREVAFIAQYGQGTCIALAAALVWRLDVARPAGAAAFLLASVGAAWGMAYVLKRIAGRVRPERTRAGQLPGAFLGPSWKTASWRESFPSSHAATAMALSASLAALYPRAAVVFWTLAVATALLRWLLEAHWLGDVVVGCGVGLLATVVARAVLA